jgi:hypothetical protein
MAFLKISDTEFWNSINKEFSNGGGVYKVIATDNEKPVAIQRLLDIDTEGVLYIGKATSFLERVIFLKTSTDPDYESSNHEFGVRYKKHETMKTKFPYYKLFVHLEASDKPDTLESEALKNYHDKFGELPPLNRRQ